MIILTATTCSKLRANKDFNHSAFCLLAGVYFNPDHKIKGSGVLGILVVVLYWTLYLQNNGSMLSLQSQCMKKVPVHKWST